MKIPKLVIGIVPLGRRVGRRRRQEEKRDLVGSK